MRSLRVFKAELSAVVEWAIGKIMPNESDAGFWTLWKRAVKAELSADGNLSTANEMIRKNRTLYVGKKLC